MPDGEFSGGAVHDNLCLRLHYVFQYAHPVHYMIGAEEVILCITIVSISSYVARSVGLNKIHLFTQILIDAKVVLFHYISEVYVVNGA